MGKKKTCPFCFTEQDVDGDEQIVRHSYRTTWDAQGITRRCLGSGQYPFETKAGKRFVERTASGFRRQAAHVWQLIADIERGDRKATVYINDVEILHPTEEQLLFHMATMENVARTHECTAAFLERHLFWGPVNTA